MTGMALLGLAVATLFVAFQPKTYTATTTAYVTAGPTSRNAATDEQAQASMAYSNTMLAKQKAAAWLPVFKTTPVMESVISQLHLKTAPAALASSVTTSLDSDAPLITVSASSSSPARARDTANAVVQATSEQVKTLEGQAAGASIKLVSNAALPSAPTFPNPRKILPIGLLAGLLVGFLIALIKHRSDTRVRTQADVENEIGTSVLAVIPQSKGLAGKSRQVETQDFQTREALRKLRTNLQFVDPDNPPRVIVVTSSRMSEGKSSIATNLARVLAASGEKVLLIDADLRRPMVGTIFEQNAEVGLSQLITGSVTFDDVVQKTEYPNMYTVTAGQIPPNPSELLGSRRMRDLLAELRQRYFVILDAPPLLPVTDAALLLPSTDGALLVVEAGKTRKEQLAQSVRNIKAVNGHVLGAVVNRADVRSGRGVLGGYGNYGNYGNYGEYGAEYGEYVAETSQASSATPAATSPESSAEKDAGTYDPSSVVEAKPNGGAGAPRRGRHQRRESGGN